MKRLLASIVCLAAASTALAEPRTITVNGTGQIQVNADRAQFTVGVSTRAASVSQAFRLNNERVARVIAAVKAKGIAAEDIQTTNFSIQQPYGPEGHIPNQYEVQNGVTVTLRDVRKVGELLQVAVDAGANQAFNVRFFVAEPQALRDRALAAAYADAKARAEKLAAAAGKTIGELLTLTTDLLPPVPRAGNTYSEAITVAAEAPIEAGAPQVLSAGVVATFELK